MAQWLVAMHFIRIAPGFFLPGQDTRFFQVGDNAKDGPLGDFCPRSNIAQARLRVAGKAKQHMRMVR